MATRRCSARSLHSSYAALSQQIEAIPGGADDVARKALLRTLPRVADAQGTTVLLSAGGAQLAALPAVRHVATRLASVAPAFVASGLLTADSGGSYISYADLGLIPQAMGRLSRDGTQMLVTFTSTQGFIVSKSYTDFLQGLRKELRAALRDVNGTVSGEVTGGLAVTSDSTTAILQDVAKSDGITVTISFLLLAAALRSVRLITLAFACLVASFGGAFLLTWPLTTAMNTPNFVTSLVISTLISLSLDYSLFLLTHLKGSTRRGVPMPQAVEAMLRSSGHTVAVSGATLAACFLVLATQPVSIVRAPGIATTFAVVSSVASNLTLTPSLLLLFPGFFAGTAARLERCTPPASPRLEALGERVESLTRRVWARVAYTTQHYKISVTVVLLAAMVVPFAVHLPHFEVSQSNRNIVPRGEPSVEALYALQDAFGPSLLTPARLLGVADAPGAALSPPFFASAHDAVDAALSASSFSGMLVATDVSGLPWRDGQPTNATLVAAAVAATAACPANTPAACRAVCPADACVLRLAAASSLSDDGRAMLLSLAVRYSLNSDDGVAWATAVRTALAGVNAATPGITWFLLVEPAPRTIEYVYEHFGDLVGITAAVVFVILAVSFRSLAISVRAVVTLCVMEIAVFGAATAIYCRNMVPPGVLHTFSGDDGLFWLMPILAFSLMTGLGLDYDIFLLTSVVEERMKGWSDADAISVGLMRSGPVISWAGIIMSVAFCGFLFSEIPLLNQLGFFVVFSVLIDTFVIRPLLVPSVMHILGAPNYWPRKVPVPSRGPLDLHTAAHALPDEEEDDCATEKEAAGPAKALAPALPDEAAEEAV